MLARRGRVLALFVGLDRHARKACGTSIRASRRPPTPMASRCSASRPDDLMFSAAKLFFAYGLGNSMTFPMAVGAGVGAAARPADPGCGAGDDAALPPDDLRRRADALRRAAGASRARAGRRVRPAAPLHLGRRAVARAYRRALARARSAATSSTGSARPRCCTSSCRTGPDDIRYGTTGKPVPGYELRIVDAGGEVADGEPGELVVRGPSAADGYWNQRDKSRRTFRGEWTHTGDTYTRDADGYYRYCGRSDDMLKVGGIWVSPFEVEEALIGHPAVLEAAVVGHPDADGLIKPKAFVVLQQAAPARRPGGADRGIAGPRQAADRRVEIPALDRVPRQPCRKPPPARSSATNCAAREGATPPI